MINWPGIIKHSDDAELVYVRDQDEWDNTADLHLFDYDGSDYLVDSSGKSYSLTTRINAQVEPQPRSETLGLQDILGLVKAHAALKGSCCVAKLYAPSINEAFKIVESMIET